MVDAFARALAQGLPWVELLPEHDRERFLAETAATLRACGSEGCFTALTDLMDEWRTTAAVWADLPLASALSQDIDQPLNLPVGTSP